ncbi:MAG: DNA polymerase III subunit delta [Rhodospirillales bacterium]|nr:DNA polymerase III subunit delta [Rhodospirillales bacterium]
MKLSGKALASFLERPPKLAAILVYGPDGGLVRERFDQLARSVCPDLGDPFRVAELTPAVLKDDPARLADEADAMALTGGRRVVRVQGAGDGLAALFQSFLARKPAEALVLVSAGDLGARSSLRKLFEDSPEAAAVPCYLDDRQAVESLIHAALRPHGLSLEPDALDYLTERLGGDRLASRAELDKLVTYMGQGGARTIRLDDVEALIGDSAERNQEDLIFAAASGQTLESQRILDRLLREGSEPVGLLRALARHLQKLHLVKGQMAAGQTAEQAINALRPKLFFKRADAFRRQIESWSLVKLAQAMELAVTAELDCKTTGMPARALCGRTFLQIAPLGKAAAGRRR